MEIALDDFRNRQVKTTAHLRAGLHGRTKTSGGSLGTVHRNHESLLATLRVQRILKGAVLKCAILEL